MFMRLLTAIFAAIFAIAPLPGLAQGWQETWGTALPLQPPPLSPFGEGRAPPPPPPPPPADQPPPPNPRLPYPAVLHDQTLRMVARTSVAGAQVRLEFANRHGAAPVHFGAVRVALAGDDGSTLPGTDRVVTFGGAEQVVLQPGTRLVSDHVDLAVGPLTKLAISVYLPGETPTETVDGIGLESHFVAQGNRTADTALPGAERGSAYFWLRGITVPAHPQGGAIIAFGDSITEGYATTPGANHAWPELLAERLQADPALAGWSVINTGISGNRVLRPGAGEAALARFTEDVLSRPGARWVVVLESINDINMTIMPSMPASQRATAEAIIAGLDQLVTRARLHGLKIAGGTVLPTGGLPFWSEEGEAMRQAVNTWIRTSGRFDAVIDFDAATRDPADPLRINPAFDPGDHVHPNDAGNRAMADAVPLGMLRD
ncbi:SGNH/GDSL hydrolase family protein [Alteraurantiacibacter buctensis]|nr:SGNH/GDSL hydrolase family protein [Alteraurantiacibacter buctensis]